jgi:hypothetical protein
MITKVNVSTIYECSLERAFKTPMLCDVSKIHTGFVIMPKVTHTTDDKDWGKAGSCKKVYVAKSITQKGGFGSVDNLIERKENQYWIIQVDNFQSWMLSFYKFVGRWEMKKYELTTHTVYILTIFYFSLFVGFLAKLSGRPI